MLGRTTFPQPPGPALTETRGRKKEWGKKKSVLLQGGRGGPSPKVRAFCNSGWPDRGKFCGLIACPYSAGLCPYSQKTEEQEMFRLRLQPMHYRNFSKCSVGKGAPWGMVLVANPVLVQDLDSSWIFTMVGISHAAQWKVMLSTQLSNQQVELKPFCPTCFVFCECCVPICDSCTLFLAPLT